MDFHGMKRKQLQALCKKHGVSANLTNREMADRLASMFKENEESSSSEKLSTNEEEIGIGDEGKVVKKPAKKVRFSPENQTFVYEVSAYGRRGRPRKQLSSKNPSQAVQNAPISEDNKAEDCRRVAKSRGQDVVESDVNMVFTPSVGRKRGRGAMKSRDFEVNNNVDEDTSVVTRSKFRSRKDVTKEKGDLEPRNGPKPSTRNARKKVQSVTLTSEVEKVEVVSRVTRQSRVQSNDEAFMLKSEVKTVGMEGGYEEVLQLKEPQKGRGKNASQKESAENSLHVAEGAKAEKPLRRSKRNVDKDGVEGATEVQSETQVTKAEEQSAGDMAVEEPQKCSRRYSSRRKPVMPQSGKGEKEKPLRRSKRNTGKDGVEGATELPSETQVTNAEEQSDGDIAVEEPQECSRRYSSRRKSVMPQSGKGEKEDHFAKRETRKRTRTTDMDAKNHNGKLESSAHALTSQDQAPLRRSRRKNVIFDAPASTDAELTIKEDIGKMQQLTAPFLEKKMPEELPRRSSRNASKFALQSSQEGNTAVAPLDLGVNQLRQEHVLEEHKTSAVDQSLVAEKPQRRSKRLTSRGASVSTSPIAKVVKKKQQRKSRMTIQKEEAAITESLAAPEELSAGQDDLVVAEDAANKSDINLNIIEHSVKNSSECSNQEKQGLSGNSGAKKQYGFEEASPLSLNMEGCRDSAGNMDKTQITTAKLVGLSTDQNMQQSADKSMVVFEKESNLTGDGREELVQGGNVESEGNCKPVNTLDDPNCSDPKLLEFESNVSYMVDSSEITFPAESQGCEMSDQEIKEDRKPLNTHSAEVSLDVYKDDTSPVESDKEVLVQGDAADSETNHNRTSWSANGRGAADGLNFFDDNNIDSSEITVLANDPSLVDQTDVIDKKLDAELAAVENTNFASDNVNAEDSRTPLADEQKLVEIKDAHVTVVESIRKVVFEDHVNESGESSGLKWGLENILMRAEQTTATSSSTKERTPNIERSGSVEATENKESMVEFHCATAETGALKITEIRSSSYCHTAASETPRGPAPETRVKDKTYQDELAVDTAGCSMSDQERSEYLKLGNAHSICEPVIIYENSGLVKNDDEIHDNTFEGNMEYQSCLLLNGTGSVMVDLGSNGSKVICPEKTSPADVFSSTSQEDVARGKTSSQTEEEKVVGTEEPSSAGNINSVNDYMDAEECRSLVEEDHIKVQLKDAKVTAAESIEEVIFSELLNELGESIGLKKESEVPLTKTEKLNATKLSGGSTLSEISTKATEIQEYKAEIDNVTATIDSPKSTDIRWSSGSDIATLKTPFGPASQSQDKVCRARITVSIAGSEMCNQDEETNLVENDMGIFNCDDTFEGEKRSQRHPSFNTTGTLDDALVDSRGVETENTVYKVDCSEMTCVADVCSSASQATLTGENSYELKVLESKESLRSENMDREHFQEYQGSMHIEDAHMSSFEPVHEVVTSDHLNELSKADPRVMEFENTVHTVFSSEMTSEADVFSSASQANISGETSNELKLEQVQESEESLRGENLDYGSDKIEVVNEDDQNSMLYMRVAEPVQEVVASDHLNEHCEADPRVVNFESTVHTVFSSEMTSEAGVFSSASQANVAGETTNELKLEKVLESEEQLRGENLNYGSDKTEVIGEKAQYEDDQNSTLLEDANVSAAEPVQEVVASDHLNELCVADPKVLDFESTVHTVFSSEMTSEADVFSSASEANIAGETSNELKLEKVLESEESSRGENLNNGSDKIEVVDEKKQFEDEQNLVLVEDANMHAAEPVQDVVASGHLNDICESCGSEEFEASLKKAEETSASDSSGKRMGQEDSSFEINKESDCNSTLISPLRPEVGSQDRQEMILHEDFEGKVLADDVCHHLSEDCQYTKDKQNDISNGADHVAGIYNEKLTFGDCVPVCNQTQENSKVVCTDNVTLRNDIPAQFSSQAALERLDNESEAAKSGAKSVEVNTRGFSNSSQALASEESLASLSLEPVSMQLDDHALLDRQKNSCSETEIVMDFAATIDNIGVSASKGTGVRQDDSTIEGTPIFPMQVEPVDHRGREVDAKLGDSHTSLLETTFQQTDILGSMNAEVPEAKPNASLGTPLPFEKANCEENKELHLQVMDDMDDSSLLEKSIGDPEEIAEATSDNCEVSVKTATFMDGNDSKSCGVEGEEPHGLNLQDNIAGDSSAVGSCSKLDSVALVKPEMVVAYSSISSICATSDEYKHLKNPDESHTLTNMEMSLFLSGEDEVKQPEAETGDSNHDGLDKAITECNSGGLKEEDGAACSDVEDIKVLVKRNGPEDVETMELRKNVSVLDAAMEDKSPQLKIPEVDTGIDCKDPFRAELSLLSSRKKNVTAKKQGTNSVYGKPLTSSILKSKSKSSLIPRTPKRLTINDMKENEPGTKREQIGSKITPRTSAKRPPLVQRDWKY